MPPKQLVRLRMKSKNVIKYEGGVKMMKVILFSLVLIIVVGFFTCNHIINSALDSFSSTRGAE